MYTSFNPTLKILIYKRQPSAKVTLLPCAGEGPGMREALEFPEIYTSVQFNIPEICGSISTVLQLTSRFRGLQWLPEMCLSSP